MIGQQSLVLGHPTVRHVVVGSICVCVREIKEPFRFILREPLVPGLLLWELRLMRAYSHLLHSVIQELKGWFPLLKRCWVFCGHKPLGKGRTDLKWQGGWGFFFFSLSFFPYKGMTHQRNAIFKTRIFRKLGGWIISCNVPVRSYIIEHQRALRFPSENCQYSKCELPTQIRMFRLKVHEEGTNCTGNEYLMTTAFFTLWH